MDLWEAILARIEAKVNRHSFYTWFKPTSFIREDVGAITVRVPNPLFKEWLTKHYSTVITEAMSELDKRGLFVNFVAESIDGAPAQLGTTEGPVFDSAATPATESDPGPGPAGLNPRYTFD